jgi:hypothetical protein
VSRKDFHAVFDFKVENTAMLCGLLFTVAWHIHGFWMEVMVCRFGGNSKYIEEKQFQTADKG